VAMLAEARAGAGTGSRRRRQRLISVSARRISRCREMPQARPPRRRRKTRSAIRRNSGGVGGVMPRA
jgi:hypothetical protein